MCRCSTPPAVARAILLAIVACVLAGCHTASGRAVEGRIGGSLSGMWRGATSLFSGELGRSRRILRSPAYRSWRPQARIAQMITTTRAATARTSYRVTTMPGRLARFPGGVARDTVQRVRSLARRDTRLVRNHQPGYLAGHLAAGIALFAHGSEFARPILHGPGDPDRSTDPDVVRRQETWIERLLRRF